VLHFKQHISYLASVSLKGRAPGTTDERQAAAYIATYLRARCDARITEQRFAFQADSISTVDTAVNIVGMVDNHAPHTMVICAHYDHLGMGPVRSRDFMRPSGIHPGADDNASGVAMLLEIARWAKEHFHVCNFIFLATSAHEVGLYGARYFVQSGLADTSRCTVLNLDMIGRLDRSSRTLKVSSTCTDTVLHSQFRKYNKSFLSLRFDNKIDNDFTVFKKKGFRAYSFTTGLHDDYHRHSDTPDKINYEGMSDMFRYITELIRHGVYF
jgi:Zn-dependent M28 family amino/carboxypeptidase